MTQTVSPQEQRRFPLWLISVTVILPTFFAMLATSATNVALPHMGGAFGATNDETKWVITSYMVSNAVFLPLTGWFESTLGRKNFLLIFLSLFGIGSVVCVFANSLNMLILGRLIQGVGGGIMMPMCQSILLQEFPKDRAGDAMALFSFATMVSSIIGPTVGGLLVDNLSWPWIFIVNIPVTILSLLLIHFVLTDTPRNTGNKKVDVIGLGSLTLWLFSMQVVLDKGQQYGWFDCTWICWLLGFSIFCAIFFVVWELENKNAMVDLTVFKNFNFSLGTVLADIANLLVYATIILLPQYLQGLMGYTASLSGLSLATRVLSAVICLTFVGSLAKIIDSRIVIVVGFLMMAASGYMFSLISLQTNFAYLFLPNFLFGAGMVLAFVPISGLALGDLPKAQISNAAGIHSLTKCVAASIFTSLASSFAISLSEVHQFYLVGNMSKFNPMFLRHFNHYYGAFLHHFPNVIAAKKANIVLYKQLMAQSKLYAYVDIFQYLTLVTVLISVLAIFLKVKKKKKNA